MQRSRQLTEAEFGQLVEEALASLPAEFRPYMENVSVEIQLRPTRDSFASLKVPPGGLVLGIYVGVPLTKKTVSAPLNLPDQIVLFQRNIEAVCESRREIVRRVRRTVLHEVGHHFGLDERRLKELGYG